MDLKFRVKRNMKMDGQLIPAGEILVLTKEKWKDLKAPLDLLFPLEEEERIKKEEDLKPKPYDASQHHFQLKEQFLEEDRIRREQEAVLLERQAEEQAKLVKSSASRLRSKNSELAVR